MQGNFIGDLFVRTSLDTRPLEQGAARAKKVTRSVSNELQGMSKRGRNAMTQLAFATDDFFGVWQNSGSVSAAIRATSNNIGTLVTMINPLAGIATTVAFAFGSSLVKAFVDTGESARDAADGIRELAEEQKRRAELQSRLNRASQRPSERQGELRDTVFGKIGPEQAKLNSLMESRRKLESDRSKKESDFLSIPIPGVGNAAFSLQKWWHGTGTEAQKQIDGINEDIDKQKRNVDALRLEYEELGKSMARIRKEEAATASSIGIQIGMAAMLSGGPGKPSAATLRSEEADRKRKADESQRKAERAADIRGDLTSILFTSDYKKRVFDINRQFDDLAKTIGEVAASEKERADLLKLNESARKKELSDARGAGAKSGLGSFKQRGSAAAYSSIIANMLNSPQGGGLSSLPGGKSYASIEARRKAALAFDGGNFAERHPEAAARAAAESDRMRRFRDLSGQASKSKMQTFLDNRDAENASRNASAKSRMDSFIQQRDKQKADAKTRSEARIKDFKSQRDIANNTAKTAEHLATIAAAFGSGAPQLAVISNLGTP